ELPGRAVLVDEIMGADLGRRIAQPGERRFGALHAGVMQDEEIDAAGRRARPVIGRGAAADRHRALHRATAGRRRSTMMATAMIVVAPPSAGCQSRRAPR